MFESLLYRPDLSLILLNQLSSNVRSLPNSSQYSKSWRYLFDHVELPYLLIRRPNSFILFRDYDLEFNAEGPTSSGIFIRAIRNFCYVVVGLDD